MFSKIIINSRYWLIGLFSVILLSSFKASSQSIDSLQPYRHFMQVCTGYQSAPLQLNVNYKVNSNLVLHPYDTASMNGYFYIGTTGKAYMQFGDVEQIIEDSIALTVNHSTQQISVSADVGKSGQLLKRYIGSLTNDTSVQNLSRAFNITTILETNIVAQNAYELYSYALVPGTVLPKQVMRVVFDSATNYPIEIATLRRTVLPIDPQDSVAFKTRFENQNVLIRIPNGGLAFVREYTNVYSYLNLRKEEVDSLPLKSSDYLLKDETGEYQLKPGKETYRLSVQ